MEVLIKFINFVTPKGEPDKRYRGSIFENRNIA